MEAVPCACVVASREEGLGMLGGDRWTAWDAPRVLG